MKLSEAPLVEEVLPSSEFYPVSIDWIRRSLSFVRIGRETYNSAAFLVPRHTDMGKKVFTFNIDDLLLHARRNPWPIVPSHYIFISAFCCSTLLARYIDELGIALVVKEPGIIAQLGFIKHSHSDLAPPLEKSEWTEVVTLSLSLMSRVFPTQTSVIVKPSDIGNLLAEDLLMHDERSRGLLLSVPLRTYILSVLKSPTRREWVRNRAKYWNKSVAQTLGLKDVNLRQMNDARKSAYIWLVTNCLWLSVRGEKGGGRALIMNGELISETPSLALRTLMDFFNINVQDEEIRKAVESDAASHHSKKPAKTYSAEQRSVDLSKWELSYSKEASEAIEWASSLAASLGLRVGEGPVVELS